MPSILHSIGINVDLNSIQQPQNFEPVPPGEYEIVIYSVGAKECDANGLSTTRDGNGKYLAMSFEIVSGEYRGRRLFYNFNFVNRSEKAMTMALEMFVKMLRAVNYPLEQRPAGPESPAELMGYSTVPFFADVDISNYNGNANNVITQFKVHNVDKAPWAEPPF